MTTEVRWCFQVLSAKFNIDVKIAKAHRTELIGNPAVLVHIPSSMQLTMSNTRDNHKRREPVKLAKETDSFCDSINIPKLRLCYKAKHHKSHATKNMKNHDKSMRMQVSTFGLQELIARESTQRC